MLILCPTFQRNFRGKDNWIWKGEKVNISRKNLGEDNYHISHSTQETNNNEKVGVQYDKIYDYWLYVHLLYQIFEILLEIYTSWIQMIVNHIFNFTLNYTVQKISNYAINLFDELLVLVVCALLPCVNWCRNQEGVFFFFKHGPVVSPN